MEVPQAMSIVLKNFNARVTDSVSHVEEGNNIKANLKIAIMTEKERKTRVDRLRLP